MQIKLMSAHVFRDPRTWIKLADQVAVVNFAAKLSNGPAAPAPRKLTKRQN
jgi:hypothetical protein